MNRKLTALTILGGFIILLVTMALAPPAANADDKYWYYFTPDYWDSTSTHWYSSGWVQLPKPTASDNVYIGMATAAVTYTVNIRNAEACNNLTFQTNSASYTSTLNIPSGSLTVGGNIINGANTGNLNLTGGTLTLAGSGTSSVDNFTLSAGTLNQNGSGTFTNSIANGAGTSYINFNTTVGGLSGASIASDYFNVGNTAQGSYTLAAGKALAATYESVGNYQSALSTFTQANSGYSNTVTDLTMGYGVYHLQSGTLSVGRILNGTGTGTFNVDGGTLTLGTSVDVENFNVGYGAVGTFTLSGSKAIIAAAESLGSFNGTNTFTQSGTSTNTVSGALTMGYGTYNLNGGTLSVGNLSNGTGTSTLNIAGGTLNLTSSMMSSVDNLTFTSGVINFNGNGLFSNSIAGGTSGTTLNINTQYGGPSGSSIAVANFNLGTAGAGNYFMGNGKTLTATIENVGGANNGMITQQDGSVNTVGTLNMAPATDRTSTYRLWGGTLNAGTIDLSQGVGTKNFEFTGGRLSVDTFNGSLNVQGGTLAPGHSPGLTTVNGNFTNSGTIEFELGGATTRGTDYDAITVNSGNVSLGGTLQLKPWNSYAPVAGSAFDLVQWDAGKTFTGGYALDTSLFGSLPGTFTAATVGINGDANYVLRLTYDLSQYSWNASSGNWATGSNWDAGTPPTASKDTVINNGGTANVTGTANANSLTIGNGTVNVNTGGTLNAASLVNGTGTGTLNVNGGTLNITGSTIDADSFNVGKAAQGTFTLANGKTLNAGAMSVGTYNSVVSTMTQNGDVNVTNNLTLGRSDYNLNGGTLSVGGNIVNDTGTSRFFINGGTLNVTGSSIGVDSFYVGQTAHEGAFTLASGKTLNAMNVYVGTYTGADSAFIQNGNVTLSNDVYIGQGIYSLNGGILTAASFINNTGSGTLNVDGGTLNVTASTIDVDNFNVGSSGAFTLASGKTLQATSVTTAGTLAVNGQVSGGTVEVTNGGTLKGSGTINAILTIDSGGVLAPGNSIGVENFAQTVTAKAGSSLQAEVNDWAGAFGVGGDGFNFQGSSNLVAEPGAFLDIINVSAETNPLNFDPNSSSSFKFFQFGSGSIINPENFTIRLFNFSPEVLATSFTLSADGTLNHSSAVPELPTGLLIPLLGVLGVGLIFIRKNFCKQKIQ